MSNLASAAVKKLHDLVEVLDHLRVPINSSERYGRKGAVPYYGANGLQGWIDEPLFNEPLILLAEDGGNFDDFATRPIAYRIDGPSWVNNHAHVIRAAQGVNQDFLFWALVNKDIRRFIAGGTRTKLNQSELRSIEVWIPDSQDEQRTIANILDTLNTQIRQTEAIIAKLQQVKQGLLHDLLTRGIDANGQLRPPRDQAPELYKESPLGWIPREWEVLSIDNLAESLVDGPFGSNLKTEHYIEGDGVRVARLQNIQVGAYDDSERAFISYEHAHSLQKNEVYGGDLLIASLGDQNNPVGRACLYPHNLPKAINKADCFRLRSSEFCTNEFLMHALNGQAAKRQVRGFEQGVTLKRINTSNLRKLKIGVPPKIEQSIICERYEGLEIQLRHLSNEREKLKKQKSGLMDDLLTGRVGVTSLLDTAKAS